MKRNYLGVVTLLAFSIIQNCLFAQSAEFLSTNFQKDVEALMLENNVPAMGIGVIEDGALRHTLVLGELKNGKPALNNAIFNIASLSKPLTTVLTLILVSNGDWDLDEPLYHYWVDPDVQDDPLHKKLTTRHVLTHQTGFDNWRWNNSSKKLTFNFEPGTQCKYSGEGFEYLRLAIEHKFNKPFEEIEDSLLFKPYGMNDTRLLWDKDFHEPRYAQEHNEKGEPYHLRKRIVHACASDDVLTTIGDYGLFAVNVMKGTGLATEVYQDMLSLQTIFDEKGGFGLGWYILNNFHGSEYAIIHDGSDKGVATKVILLPETRRGIIMFTNGDKGFDIIKKVEDEYLDDIPILSNLSSYSQTKPDENTGLHEVEATLNQFQNGYTNRDTTIIDEFLEMFTEDIVYMGVASHEFFKGKESVRKLTLWDWERWFDLRIPLENVDIRINDDVAWFEVVGESGPWRNGKTYEIRMVGSLIRKDKWMFKQVCFSYPAPLKEIVK